MPRTPVTITLSREELSRRGRAGVTKRWAESRALTPERLAVDLGALSIPERRLVLALIEARRAAAAMPATAAEREGGRGASTTSPTR